MIALFTLTDDRQIIVNLANVLIEQKTDNKITIHFGNKTFEVKESFLELKYLLSQLQNQMQNGPSLKL